MVDENDRTPEAKHFNPSKSSIRAVIAKKNAWFESQLHTEASIRKTVELRGLLDAAWYNMRRTFNYHDISFGNLAAHT